VNAVCFCEMWVLGMCNLSWCGTIAVVGDIGFSIGELSVSKMFSKSVGTVVVGGVDGAGAV
jgi:hypothetical protein